MDSRDYFLRAEKANRRFQHAVIVLLIICVGVLLAGGIAVFELNKINHKNSIDQLNTITQNQVNLNQNLSDSIKCILLLTPQTYNAQSVNACFALHNNVTGPPKSK